MAACCDIEKRGIAPRAAKQHGCVETVPQFFQYIPINDAEGGFDGRDSAVLVRSRVRWIVALSRLSGVVPEKCDAMVRDLTFELRRSLDLHVHPFVPLDSFDDDFGHRSPIPSSQPSG
jgi:hypothetical protein